MVSREMMHDAHILDQATEVARRKHQIELVFSIALFDYTELAINIGRFSFHMIELFVTETSYGLLPVAHELVLRCRRYERFGIGPRKLVHRHHGLGGFDLPHGAEFLEFAERIYRYQDRKSTRLNSSH